MTERKASYIQTFSGGRIWPLDPRVEDIDLEDMVAAKSKLCRYGGHCLRFYSVLEHEALMMECARKHAVPAHVRRQMGLHDASEAYLIDLPRPLKRSMPEYLPAEEQLMQVIAQACGLDYPFDPLVKEYDERIGLTERAQNLAEPVGYEWHINFEAKQPLPVTLRCLSPDDAVRFWLFEYQRAGGAPVIAKWRTAA